MPILNRDGIMVTERHKIPVQEIVRNMCENRRMSRVTGRYPIEVAEVWDAVDVYVETIHSASIADMEIVPFGREQIDDQFYQLEVAMITEEMYVALMRHGRRYTDQEEDLDFLYQMGMYTAVCESLEYMCNQDDVRDTVERSELHFCVLAALENAYQGDLDQDCRYFLDKLIESGSPEYT